MPRSVREYLQHILDETEYLTERSQGLDIDLEPYLHGPIFEPIRKDSSVFRSVTVKGGTIAWDNGADIDPDVLYYDLKPAWMEKPEIV
jgi:hypothetical protein